MWSVGSSVDRTVDYALVALLMGEGPPHPPPPTLVDSHGDSSPNVNQVVTSKTEALPTAGAGDSAAAAVAAVEDHWSNK